MNAHRIKISIFADVSGYSNRNIYYLRKNKPETVEYDPSDNTYSLDKALAIAKIRREQYTVFYVATQLNVQEQAVRRLCKEQNMGTQINNHMLYLSLDEIELLRVIFE